MFLIVQESHEKQSIFGYTVTYREYIYFSVISLTTLLVCMIQTARKYYEVEDDLNGIQ